MTLVGIATGLMPFAVVLGLLAWSARRERRRREVHARQIALTDAVHERLGAVAAPVVRRRRRGWQVSLAVPGDRPAMTQALLIVVLEALAPREATERPVEIVVTRQPASFATPADEGGVRRESLSWT